MFFRSIMIDTGQNADPSLANPDDAPALAHRQAKPFREYSFLLSIGRQLIGNGQKGIP